MIEFFFFLFLFFYSGKALASGIASGIGGLFYQPFKGAKEGGVGGFFGGLGKGLVGVVAKPVAGTLEAVR